MTDQPHARLEARMRLANDDGRPVDQATLARALGVTLRDPVSHGQALAGRIEELVGIPAGDWTG